MVRTLPLIVLAAAMAVGCATTPAPPPAVPAPAPAPAPAPHVTPPAVPAPAPAQKLTGLEFRLLRGWHPVKTDNGLIALQNPSKLAQIILVIVPRSQGTPLEAVQNLRQDLAKTPGIVMRPIHTSVASHAVVWRYTTPMPKIHRVIQGTALAMPSNLPGYSIMLTGLWPVPEDPKLLPQFFWMAEHIRLK